MIPVVLFIIHLCLQLINLAPLQIVTLWAASDGCEVSVASSIFLKVELNTNGHTTFTILPNEILVM
jgi:hypothetical protein